MIRIDVINYTRRRRNWLYAVRIPMISNKGEMAWFLSGESRNRPAFNRYKMAGVSSVSRKDGWYREKHSWSHEQKHDNLATYHFMIWFTVVFLQKKRRAKRSRGDR